VSFEKVVELAGYFGAHAIWCVSDAESLVPMLAAQGGNGAVRMVRFEADELTEAVATARAAFEANQAGDECAALLYDGFVTLATGKTDAIVVELVHYRDQHRATLALPYRHASDPSGFAVFRPKFLDVPEALRGSVAVLGEALFRGVDRHAKGAAVWSRYLDDSH
jgi:hypothetical protein